jgi:hypothetical protein
MIPLMRARQLAEIDAAPSQTQAEIVGLRAIRTDSGLPKSLSFAPPRMSAYHPLLPVPAPIKGWTAVDPATVANVIVIDSW